MVVKSTVRFSSGLVFIAILVVTTIPFSCKDAGPSDRVFGGVVSAATPEAAAAGVEILELGGNAVDAAVAVSISLAVTEPAMSGIGGQTQMMIRHPGKDPIVINGTSRSPGGTPTDASESDIVAHKSTTIPSTVRVLDYARKKYGSGKLAWAELIKPAVKYAEEGFVVGPFRHRVWARHQEDLLGHSSTRTLFLDEDDTIPEEGALWKQSVLAETLRRLAMNGADEFYSGTIARDIANDMEKNGGWITLEDLQNFPQPVELRSLESSYRDWKVFTLPPPGGGWVVLQILNLLERVPARQLRPRSLERSVRLAEVLQIGQNERKANPVENLIDFHEDVSVKISKEAAEFLLKRESDGSSGETTHFCVVDATGMVVSATASINSYFGARVASKKLGFLYNNYMKEFETGNPDHPFALRPNAMPYSNMSPTIITNGGDRLLALGSPGSSRIIASVVQVIQLWVDGKMDIGKAVASRRIHAVADRRLYIESRDIPDHVRVEFEASGYRIEEPRWDLADGDLNPYFGGVHAAANKDGVWRAAADPRRDGVVKYAELKH